MFSGRMFLKIEAVWPYFWNVTRTKQNQGIILEFWGIKVGLLQFQKQQDHTFSSISEFWGIFEDFQILCLTNVSSFRNLYKYEHGG